MSVVIGVGPSGLRGGSRMPAFVLCQIGLPVDLQLLDAAVMVILAL